MIPRAVARFYIGRLLARTKPARADKRRRSRSAERGRGFGLPVHFYNCHIRRTTWSWPRFSRPSIIVCYRFQHIPPPFESLTVICWILGKMGFHFFYFPAYLKMKKYKKRSGKNAKKNGIQRSYFLLIWRLQMD